MPFDPRPPSTPAGASLSDILTIARQLVQAVNQLTTTYLNIQGAQNSAVINALLLVKGSAGRICEVSVTAAGSGTGLIYDTNTVTDTSTPVYIIPMAVGIYVVNLPLAFGLLVQPGAGQTLTVSYS